MNRARIEEFVRACYGPVSFGNEVSPPTEITIRAALTTLAKECYEEAAKMCDDENIMPGSHYADAIRCIAEEVEK